MDRVGFRSGWGLRGHGGGPAWQGLGPVGPGAARPEPRGGSFLFFVCVLVLFLF